MMEAMAMAKPVIVTSDALEGIDAVVGEELVLADTAQAYAAAACRLADDRVVIDSIVGVEVRRALMAVSP